jgi:hypothetical protein
VASEAWVILPRSSFILVAQPCQGFPDAHARMLEISYPAGHHRRYDSPA